MSHHVPERSLGDDAVVVDELDQHRELLVIKLTRREVEAPLPPNFEESAPRWKSSGHRLEDIHHIDAGKGGARATTSGVAPGRETALRDFGSELATPASPQ